MRIKIVKYVFIRLINIAGKQALLIKSPKLKLFGEFNDLIERIGQLGSA